MLEFRSIFESPFFDCNLARHATEIKWLILESDNRGSPGVDGRVTPGSFNFESNQRKRIGSGRFST